MDDLLFCASSLTSVLEQPQLNFVNAKGEKGDPGITGSKGKKGDIVISGCTGATGMPGPTE